MHYAVSVVVHNKLLLFQAAISDELRARATVVPSSTNKEDCTIPEASSTAAGGCTKRVVCSTDCLKELLETVCREPGCNCLLTVSSRIVGCTVAFTWDYAVINREGGGAAPNRRNQAMDIPSS